MDLYVSVPLPKWEVILSVLLSLLCLTIQAENCPTEIVLELKVNSNAINHFSSIITTEDKSYGVWEGDSVEIICKAPSPVSLRYKGYPV